MVMKMTMIPLRTEMWLILQDLNVVNLDGETPSFVSHLCCHFSNQG